MIREREREREAMETIATSGTSQQTLSVDEVASNDDLLIRFLLHLPIISLLKFKSVSKRWFSLISSPYFSRLRNPIPLSGLFLPISSAIAVPNYKFVPLDGRPSIPLSFSFSDDPNNNSKVTMLQSCNGFLLCCSPKLGEGSKQQMYFIINPTTHRFTLLPELVDQVFHPVVINPTTHRFTLLPELADQDNHRVVSVAIAFDPSKFLHYKVVCVRDYNSVMPDGYQIEIYSSESGSWRQSGDVFTAPDHKFNHGVYWNGAIHWINDFRTMNIGEVESILRFDVNEERFREMPMPEIPHDWNQVRVRYFGESRNHLHLILLEGPSTARFNVYEMEKDYSRWFLKHQVDLDSVITTAFPEVRHGILGPENLIYYNFSILCHVRGETDEDSFLVLCVHGKDRKVTEVICYCLKDGTFMKLCDLGFTFSRWQCAYQYIESLVCVK